MDSLEIRSNNHSFFTIIPNIIFDLRLSPIAFTLYAHIRRIAGDYGSCFKSIKHLADECCISERSARNYIKILAKPLEALGGQSLITIEVRKRSDGADTSHLIRICEVWDHNHLKYKKSIGRGQEMQGEGAGDAGGRGQEMQTIKKNNNKEDLSKEIEREREAPPPAPKKIEKPLRGECVRLSDVEMQKLEATYGAKAQQYIKDYDLYLEESGGKLRNGRAPVSCYAGIQRWAAREKAFAPKNKDEKSLDNKSYATQRAAEINKNQHIFEACITVEGVRIEDRRKLGVEYNVSFKELAFREQFDNLLRKLGLIRTERP